jgi:hypothetical protein
MSKNRKPLVPKKDEWDPNEWQGRSKQQVDGNNWAAAATIILMGAVIVFSIIYEMITRWLN